MNKQKPPKINKYTIFLLIILGVTYIIGAVFYSSLANKIIDIMIPKVQKKFYVELTITSDYGDFPKNASANEAYITPLAKSIAALLIMITILIFSYYFISKFYKKNKQFMGINKIVKIIEIILIFSGIFVFIYKLNLLDKTYGIYKQDFKQESNLAYYQVKEMPFIVDDLENVDIGILGEVKMFFITKSDEIVHVLEIFIAISGALLLPLKYSVNLENKIVETEKQKKISNDIRSQVGDIVKREMNKWQQNAKNKDNLNE